MSQAEVSHGSASTSPSNAIATSSSSSFESSLKSANLTHSNSSSNSTVFSSNSNLSDSTKKIPESFGKLVSAHDPSKPVPQSLGTDNGATNIEVGQKSQNQKDSLLYDKQNAGFSGTLLTEDGNMEYDELTGDLHRVGESIDDYFFEFAPETPINKPLLDSFKNFALENKMSIATAKKIAHFYDAQMQKSNAQQFAKSHEEQVKMRNICVNDPEIGGAKFHENLRLAKAGIRRFDSDGNLAKILDETGFGSHPEVLRFMHRVGKAFAESPMVTGAKPKHELSTAELFYPSMRKK